MIQLHDWTLNYTDMWIHFSSQSNTLHHNMKESNNNLYRVFLKSIPSSWIFMIVKRTIRADIERTFKDTIVTSSLHKIISPNNFISRNTVKMQNIFIRVSLRWLQSWSPSSSSFYYSRQLFPLCIIFWDEKIQIRFRLKQVRIHLLNARQIE